MRTGYHTCSHTLYDKIPRLFRNSDSLESWSDILEKQEATSNHEEHNRQNALWMTVAGRENISPIRLIFKRNNLKLSPASTCDCSRFDGLRGLHILKAHWCKQHNFLIGECKSIDRVMNLDYTNSIQDPIAEQHHSKQAKNPAAQS